MRSKLLYILAVVLALSIAALMPWLAWREARRQAYEVEADLVLTYARDTVHRADETARQSFAAILSTEQLQGARGSNRLYGG